MGLWSSETLRCVCDTAGYTGGNDQTLLWERVHEMVNTGSWRFTCFEAPFVFRNIVTAKCFKAKVLLNVCTWNKTIVCFNVFFLVFSLHGLFVVQMLLSIAEIYFFSNALLYVLLTFLMLLACIHFFFLRSSSLQQQHVEFPHLRSNRKIYGLSVLSN